MSAMGRLEDELLQRRPFSTDKERLIVALMRTNAWLYEQLQRTLQPYGITQQQYNVLRILRGSDVPLSTCDIRRRMIDRASDTSRIVARLIEKGLVEKCTCATDRRRVEVRITPKGRKLLEKLDPVIRQFHEHAAVLTPQQRQQLMEMLDRLRSSGDAHN